MARVLVVNHDLDVADLEVDALRRAGHQVDQCGGPSHARTACPVLHGLPCWQVEWADVLVYDAWAGGDGAADLTKDLHLQYPGKAIVLTSTGMELSWSETEGPDGVTTVVGAPTRASLSEAVEEALVKVASRTSA